MMAQADWTQVLIAYGKLRNWKPLATRRALKKFALETGLDLSGFAADRAFRLGYNALADATAEQRAACTDWQSVKDLMTRQEQDHIAAIAAKLDANKQLVESLRGKRCWVLAGFYLGDETISRYTLDELEAWLDWATGRWVYRDPSVYAHAVNADGSVITSVNWSIYFRDVSGNKCPAAENMTDLAADLSAYTNQRRGWQAERN